MSLTMISLMTCRCSIVRLTVSAVCFAAGAEPGVPGICATTGIESVRTAAAATRKRRAGIRLTAVHDGLRGYAKMQRVVRREVPTNAGRGGAISALPSEFPRVDLRAGEGQTLDSVAALEAVEVDQARAAGRVSGRDDPAACLDAFRDTAKLSRRAARRDIGGLLDDDLAPRHDDESAHALGTTTGAEARPRSRSVRAPRRSARTR